MVCAIHCDLQGGLCNSFHFDETNMICVLAKVRKKMSKLLAIPCLRFVDKKLLYSTFLLFNNVYSSASMILLLLPALKIYFNFIAQGKLTIHFLY